MIQKIFHRFIVSRTKEIPFIIFFWFLIAFLVSRIFTWLMFSHIIPTFYMYIKGVHIHHLNYGIFFLAITGFIALAFPLFTQKHRHGLAMIYGIGLGVASDEFAMWLLLEDNYWARLSYDAVLIISLVLLNIIYFKGFWLYMAKKMKLLRPKKSV